MNFPQIGAGFVVGLGISLLALTMLVIGHSVGWEATWRAFGVTPLLPPFFDMHVINDYAACAAKGIDPYAPQACNIDNFNIPRAWLWLGHLGIDGTDSVWLSMVMIGLTSIVLALLFGAQPRQCGLFGLAAVASPTVLMGVERGNMDIFILALVASAALLYDETRRLRTIAALLALIAGVFLKLFPVFCLCFAASRFSRRKILFALTLAAISAIYLALTLDDIFLIRRNVPTTFILSYGYKSIFLGIDHIRGEAGLMPLHLADTWLPAVLTLTVLAGAMVWAVARLNAQPQPFTIPDSAAGRAFLFGAGIYIGTYLLGTNFVYRLMFLVLCVPQLLDWQAETCNAPSHQMAAVRLFGTVLAVLWLNGNANGHMSFLLLPQFLNWVLFSWLSHLLLYTSLRSLVSRTLQPGGRA